jgi:aspartate kinase
MNTLVMKFGGTSVGTAERMEQVIELAAESAGQSQVVVVLSAMSGVTNALIAGAEHALVGNMDAANAEVDIIASKHNRTIESLFGKLSSAAELSDEIAARLADLKILYKGISYLGELSKRSLDAVSGMGELMSSAIVAKLAGKKGIKAEWLDARQFIITDDTFGRANPRWDKLTAKTKQVLSPLAGTGTIAITQGFIGATESGAYTTLGRGGSDYSASIIGVATDAKEIQIWTDVDGMMTADPRIIANAKVLPAVSFQEASELAYFGAKVLHPLTIKPAVEKKIPVRILNTMRPKEPGTLITETVDSNDFVRAIASKKKITTIFISSPKMLMSHGFLAKIFAVFDKYQTSIDTIATSEISVALTIDSAEFLTDIVEELGEYGDVRTLEDAAIVSVVGRQYRTQSGIAGRVFSCLKDLNIVVISGGASDINLSFVVASADADQAIKRLHAEFFPQ